VSRGGIGLGHAATLATRTDSLRPPRSRPKVPYLPCGFLCGIAEIAP
jgi:hypothetical protein